MSLILFVEDCGHAADLLEWVLRKSGYEVQSASNAWQALAAIKKAMPDLVLLDLEMPARDGLNFLESLRQSIGPAALPVILLTGVEDESVIQRATQLGVERVFCKGGFHAAELLEFIARLIRSR